MEFNKGGYWFTAHLSGRLFWCALCGAAIELGTPYYSVVRAGSGVDPHPDRIHIEEVQAYLEKYANMVRAI